MSLSPSPPVFRRSRGVFTLIFSLGILSGSSSVCFAQAPASSAPAVVKQPPTRIYADAFLVWIYEQPALSRGPIGYIRAGQSVALRKTAGLSLGSRVKGGCGRGWYAIEPVGFICLDSKASLKATRYNKSMSQLLPSTGAYPFEYALSMGTPAYRRIPTPEEWERKERVFGRARVRPLPPHWRGHAELVTDQKMTNESVPSSLKNRGSVARLPDKRLVRRNVPFGSMLAITSSFESHGRSFLHSADGTLVPADRLRLFRPSTFEGVELNVEQNGGAAFQLPLAWPRKQTRHYKLIDSALCNLNRLTANKTSRHSTKERVGQVEVPLTKLDKRCLLPLEEWALTRHPVNLTGRTVDISGTRFVETTRGHLLAIEYLYVAQQRNLPGNASEEPDGTPRRWIHFRISQGTLVAYEGARPVFATLASPGMGGVPSPGADPLDTRTTPVGTYRIQFKHQTDDMSPQQTEHRDFWIADVPHAMYFKQPFAIHVAYWHESFGAPMSGGCINVSPKDGNRLFSFTSPTLPADWYGVGASKSLGYGTTVRIDR